MTQKIATRNPEEELRKAFEVRVRVRVRVSLRARASNLEEELRKAFEVSLHGLGSGVQP